MPQLIWWDEADNLKVYLPLAIRVISRQDCYPAARVETPSDYAVRFLRKLASLGPAHHG